METAPQSLSPPHHRLFCRPLVVPNESIRRRSTPGGGTRIERLSPSTMCAPLHCPLLPCFRAPRRISPSLVAPLRSCRSRAFASVSDPCRQFSAIRKKTHSSLIAASLNLFFLLSFLLFSFLGGGEGPRARMERFPGAPPLWERLDCCGGGWVGGTHTGFWGEASCGAKHLLPYPTHLHPRLPALCARRMTCSAPCAAAETRPGSSSARKSTARIRSATTRAGVSRCALRH